MLPTIVIDMNQSYFQEVMMMEQFGSTPSLLQASNMKGTILEATFLATTRYYEQCSN